MFDYCRASLYALNTFYFFFFQAEDGRRALYVTGVQTCALPILLRGPAREGLALLQGLLLCGHCGRAVTVRYTGHGGIYPAYLCNWLHREGLATKDCLSFRCDVLDSVIAEEVLNALQPAELELALAALQELETRDQAIMRQWQMRLERAEYEAALAERRYQEVDPSHRLVASTLERRWNDALVQLQDLKK